MVKKSKRKTEKFLKFVKDLKEICRGKSFCKVCKVVDLYTHNKVVEGNGKELERIGEWGVMTHACQRRRERSGVQRHSKGERRARSLYQFLNPSGDFVTTTPFRGGFKALI